MTAILPLQNPPRIKGGFETIVRGPILGRDGNPLDEAEWRVGVEGEGLPDSQFFSNKMRGGSWGDPNIDPTDRKPVSGRGNTFTFKPAGVGVSFECYADGANTTIGDIPMQHARNEMRRRLWSLIGEHIQNVGTSIDCPDQPGTNRTLAGSAQLPDGYDDAHPGDIEGTLQGLLDMVCEFVATDPVFLVPYSWKTHFTRRGIVRWDDAQECYIALGVYRIAFDCFDNVGPTGTTTNDDGSEVWIYAMVAPQVTVADEGEGDIVSYRTKLQNIYGVRAERQFGYWFDADTVYAAKTTIL